MSCKKHRCIISYVFLSVLFLSLPLSAGSGDAAAQTAYKEAKQLFDQEEYARAADKFREAYELKPSWKILFNIGQCEAAAKNHGLALEAFEMFLSEGGDDILNDRREQVISEVDRLRHMVGYIKVNAPKGTEIRIDGRLRGTAPAFMAFPVAAARTHTLEGTLNGTSLESHEFRVVGAQTLTIELKATEQTQPVAAVPADESKEGTAVASSEPDSGDESEGDTSATTDDGDGEGNAPAETTSPGDKSKLKLAGWIVTGVGAGALIAGGILGGVALKENSDLKEFCGNDPCPEKKDEVASNQTMANVSTVLFVGGGVVAATGVVLLILGTKKEKQTAKNTTIYPTISRDTVGAALEWRF
ncbi:MAG: tetratricopeptide repeat protein [Deltaproteobacteria bacterium]|nr:tetratricopeptide repeat protein [Deltaproteobacteria bacterium]MBN2673409.1 tetratricopeptide repeat protein [Deltaproteobacteria bacterium]